MATIRDISSRKHVEDHARRVADAVRAAEARERQRVARELHDGVGQLATAVTLELAAIEGMDETPPHIVERLQHVRQLMSDVTRELSHTAHGLHPIALESDGLIAAIRRYLFPMIERADLKCVFEVDLPGAFEFHKDVEAVFYRLTQEAITNVIRHAEAQNLRLSVRVDDRSLRLEVADDGRGFDVSQATDGLGIPSMRARVRELGGHTKLESGPEGTCFRVMVPRAQGFAET